MSDQQHTYVIATDGAFAANNVKAFACVAGWGFVAVRSDGMEVERRGYCAGA